LIRVSGKEIRKQGSVFTTDILFSDLLNLIIWFTVLLLFWYRFPLSLTG